MKNPRIPPELLARARDLRKNMTKAEILLWEEFRKWRNQGTTMRRQHIVPPFIIDFAETTSKTAIEVDGISHIDNYENDTKRQTELEQRGWTFLRFSDREVLLDSSKVARSVFDYINSQKEQELQRRRKESQLKDKRYSSNLFPPLEGEGVGRGQSQVNKIVVPPLEGEGSRKGHSQVKDSLVPPLEGEGMGRGQSQVNKTVVPPLEGEGLGRGQAQNNRIAISPIEGDESRKDQSQTKDSLVPPLEGEGMGRGQAQNNRIAISPKEGDESRKGQSQIKDSLVPPLEGEGMGRGHDNFLSISGNASLEQNKQLRLLLAHPALKLIAEKTKSTPYENNLYLVGGAVRDALLNRKPKNDLDIVTELDAQALAKKLDKNAKIYPRFGTAMIRVAHTNIELVTARKESYDATSRKPHTRPATLLDDAKRRDFTVNTLLLNIHTGELYDPLNSALSDLESRTLRTPLDPAETFHDDPLRMLRAVRFKHQLAFEYSETSPPKSLLEKGRGGPGGRGVVNDLPAALAQESHRLSIISQERIRDEFTKILVGPKPDKALQELLDFGLLHPWASELERMVGVEQGKWHYADVWTHTLHVVNNVASTTPLLPADESRKGQSQIKDSLVRPLEGEGMGRGRKTGQAPEILLAALLHDIAKPLTRTIDERGDTRFFDHENVGASLAYELCLRWRYSQETARNVQLLVKNHMRLSGIKTLSTPATRRIIRDLGPQLENWLALIDADANALKKGVRKLDLSTIKNKIAEVKNVQPKSNWNSPLSGKEIMDITGQPPGPDIGKLKTALENLVIEGKVQPDDKESAKDALQTILRNRPKS